MSAEQIERRLYLDIDKTVLDSDLLKEKIISALAVYCKLTVEKITTYYDQYKETLSDSTDFDPRELAEHIARFETNFASQKLKSVILHQKNFEGIVFSDVEGALTEISLAFAKDSLRVGVYSEAVEWWQEIKLLHANIDGKFDGGLRIIRRRKLAKIVLAELPLDAAVVDDKKVVVNTLAAERPDIHVIWLNRKSNEKSEVVGVHTIHSLKELPKLLRRLWLGPDETTQPK